MQTGVIVVGAGPAGLMLASELTLAGIPAVVLEKQRTRSTQSRAGALQPRTAEVLDLRGLLDPLLDRALPPAVNSAGISPRFRSSWTAGRGGPATPIRSPSRRPGSKPSWNNASPTRACRCFADTR
jgi:2-polyprenyl-6-methoxyphenol hydroxylase-like FAD-dependent oxidoreductase